MIITSRHDVTEKIKNKLVAHTSNFKRLGLAQLTGLKDVSANLVKKKIQRDLSSQVKLLSEVYGQHIRQLRFISMMFFKKTRVCLHISSI